MSRFSNLLDDFFYRPDEDVGPLFELSSTPDETPAPIQEELAEFLAFELDAETYAVPIQDVREIVKVPPLTEIPRSSASLLGVMNLRGEVLPVYDVKMRLKLADAPPRIAGPSAEIDALPRAARVLIVRGHEGVSGVLVDSVREVVRLKPSSLEPPPPGVSGDRDCVVGLGRWRDHLHILIDIHQALE